MFSLQDYINEKVDLVEIVKELIGGEGVRDEGSELRGFCPFHKDSKPSFYLNRENKKWYCHSCQVKGHSPIELIAKIEGINLRDVRISLYHQFVRPIIRPELINKWVNELWDSSLYLSWLINKRFLSDIIIQKYNLGLDGTGRITLPVHNQFGLIINCRRVHPQPPNGFSKIISYKKGYGKSFIYPILELINNKEIVLTEGELDALALLSRGVPAVSTTSGAQNWPKDPVVTELFTGKKVYICYDNDESGINGRKLVIEKLRRVAKAIYIVDVPTSIGKDVTDWIAAGAKKKANWTNILKNSRLVLNNPFSEDIEVKIKAKSGSSIIPISEAINDKYYNTNIVVQARIIGRQALPFLLPKIVQARCVSQCDKKKCKSKLKEGDVKTLELDFNVQTQEVLFMAGANDLQINAMLKKLLGLHCKECVYSIEHISKKTVEKLIVIPLVGSDTGQYQSVNCYYIDKCPLLNKPYKLDGMIVPHPKDQVTTLYFKKSLPLLDSVETFNITEKLYNDLKCFQPSEYETVEIKLKDIADWQARHITKIWEREDVHIATDLVYHSVDQFELQTDLVKRGMLDILIFGDSRTGKNKVCERLCEYYELGEVASGENASYSGIVGGVDGSNKQWIIRWGLLPQNNGGLAVIDEMAELSIQEISRLSRIRSEGIAEIHKIQREVCPAMVRLIWLSNPRKGKSIHEYDSGVLALKELIGNSEDIARFDFVVCLSKGEVSINKINKIDLPFVGDFSKYSRKLFRSLILWAWSRKKDQIKITEQAVNRVIEHSIQLGEVYESDISLIQIENVRYKLAKIACAIAARLFSTEDGTTLTVDVPHVDYAADFLKWQYNKRTFGYDEHSSFSKQSAVIGTETENRELDLIFKANDILLVGVRSLEEINYDNLSVYTGDPYSSRSIISKLVQLKCLRWDKGTNRYTKTKRLIDWIVDKTSNNSNNNGITIMK